MALAPPKCPACEKSFKLDRPGNNLKRVFLLKKNEKKIDYQCLDCYHVFAWSIPRMPPGTV